MCLCYYFLSLNGWFQKKDYFLKGMIKMIALVLARLDDLMWDWGRDREGETTEKRGLIKADLPTQVGIAASQLIMPSSLITGSMEHTWRHKAGRSQVHEKLQCVTISLCLGCCCTSPKVIYCSLMFTQVRVCLRTVHIVITCLRISCQLS